MVDYGPRKKELKHGEPLIVLALLSRGSFQATVQGGETQISLEVSLSREDKRSQSFGRPWRTGKLLKDKGQSSGYLQKGLLESLTEY